VLPGARHSEVVSPVHAVLSPGLSFHVSLSSVEFNLAPLAPNNASFPSGSCRGPFPDTTGREAAFPVRIRASITASLGLIFLSASMLLIPAISRAQTLPSREGTCVRTKIANVGHRLRSGENGPPIEGSGSAVLFANQGRQVSYDELPEIQASRPGDPVLMCLVQIPRNCPPGDNRGRWYTTTNLRTMKSWTLPDSQHSCGGA